MILGMTAPAVLTQRSKDDVVITNLIVVKLSGGRAGWRLHLCNCQTLLRGEKSERIPRGDPHFHLRCVPRTRVGLPGVQRLSAVILVTE